MPGAAMMDTYEAYNVLGIQPTPATDRNSVRKAFRKLVLQYHPDKNQDKPEAEKKNSEERFKQINSANSKIEEKLRGGGSPMPSYTPRGHSSSYTPRGQSSSYTPGGQSSSYTPRGQSSSYTPRGQSSSYTPRGQSSSYTPRGQAPPYGQARYSRERQQRRQQQEAERQRRQQQEAERQRRQQQEAERQRRQQQEAERQRRQQQEAERQRRRREAEREWRRREEQERERREQEDRRRREFVRKENERIQKEEEEARARAKKVQNEAKRRAREEEVRVWRRETKAQLESLHEKLTAENARRIKESEAKKASLEETFRYLRETTAVEPLRALVLRLRREKEETEELRRQSVARVENFLEKKKKIESDISVRTQNVPEEELIHRYRQQVWQLYGDRLLAEYNISTAKGQEDQATELLRVYEGVTAWADKQLEASMGRMKKARGALEATWREETGVTEATRELEFCTPKGEDATDAVDQTSLSLAHDARFHFRLLTAEARVVINDEDQAIVRIFLSQSPALFRRLRRLQDAGNAEAFGLERIIATGYVKKYIAVLVGAENSSATRSNDGLAYVMTGKDNSGEADRPGLEYPVLGRLFEAALGGTRQLFKLHRCGMLIHGDVLLDHVRRTAQGNWQLHTPLLYTSLHKDTANLVTFPRGGHFHTRSVLALPPVSTAVVHENTGIKQAPYQITEALVGKALAEALPAGSRLFLLTVLTHSPLADLEALTYDVLAVYRWLRAPGAADDRADGSTQRFSRDLFLLPDTVLYDDPEHRRGFNTALMEHSQKVMFQLWKERTAWFRSLRKDGSSPGLAATSALRSIPKELRRVLASIYDAYRRIAQDLAQLLLSPEKLSQTTGTVVTDFLAIINGVPDDVLEDMSGILESNLSLVGAGAAAQAAALAAAVRAGAGLAANYTAQLSDPEHGTFARALMHNFEVAWISHTIASDEDTAFARQIAAKETQ